MKREHWLLAQKTRRFFIKSQEKGTKQEHARSMSTGWNGMCSSFCLTLPNEDWMYPHASCYSGLGSYYKAPLGAVAMVVGITESYGSSGATPYELRLPYLDWLLNESPWADSFVTKSAAQCLRMHTVVQDTTVPGNLMVGGAVALRRMWEQAPIFYVWNDLVKAGVNKNLAYILAHIANTGGSGKPTGTMSWTNTQEGGHQNLAIGYLTKSYALNFMNGVYKANGDYKTTQTYMGYSHMFEVGDNTNRKLFATWVRDNMPTKLEEEDKVEQPVAVVNPFAAARKEPTVTGGKLPYNTAIKLMAAFAPTILKEIGYEQR